MSKVINIVECPRDAMQGWSHFIPTAEKIRYINTLLQVGFDTIDFGSFVSPKVIPQMKDTSEVLAGLDDTGSSSQLLAIIANLRGAETASQFDKIKYLGYPFSVSETFQLRNANATITDSLNTVEQISRVCRNSGKKLVVYISMAFGNPYGDAYTPEVVYRWVEKIQKSGADIISLADTVGIATPEQVFEVTDYLVNSMPAQEFGVHLHSGPDNWQQKLQAALDAGCRRFDGALKGIGGCPMADDVLVGNMNTEWMISYFESQGFQTGINKTALASAAELATNIFT
ncbi:MAG: hydroxymethylglutaryl-CoA lyase [Chitinophagaceae bacterium]|nr:MAG: hydroxymethylglutaryl-CoA lyase [Chitinophagaceae bacterium]